MLTFNPRSGKITHHGRRTEEISKRLFRVCPLLGNVWVCSYNPRQYYSLPLLLLKKISRLFMGILRKPLRITPSGDTDGSRLLASFGCSCSSYVLSPNLQGINGNQVVVSEGTTKGGTRPRRSKASPHGTHDGNRTRPFNSESKGSENVQLVWRIMPVFDLAPHKGEIFTYNFPPPRGPSGLAGFQKLKRKATIRVESRLPVKTYWTDSVGLENYNRGFTFKIFNRLEWTTSYKEEVDLPFRSESLFLIIFNPNNEPTPVFFELLL